MKKTILTCFVLSILTLITTSSAQKQSKLDLALRTLENNREGLGLSQEDLSDLIVTDLYESEHNGVTHIYFMQRYKGIPVHNAITSVHIAPNGKVFDSPSRFFSDLKRRVNSTHPKLNEVQALTRIVEHLDIPNALVPKNVSRNNEGKTSIAKTNFTQTDIPVKLVYYPDANGNLKLAWDLNLEMSVSDDYWSIRVDAISGEILDKQNLNIKCSFDHPGHERCVENQKVYSNSNHSTAVKEAVQNDHTNNFSPAPAPNSYNVVPVPFESPKHGPRQILVNPAITTASPYGWHDTNGAAGAEYNITRGNNVYAYPDRNGDDLTDNNEPNGGTDLIFDFPFDQNGEPAVYLKAATVNLFYMVNMMHDVTYGFGFNEVAGNFQNNNYGKGGAGNDHVRAEAQDGSGTSNANFSTPADGNSGRMQMFLWLSAGAETYIAKPDSLIGNIDSRRASGWGGAPPPTITAEAVIGSDHSNTPTLGCSNGFLKSEVQGKIVLIERGTCEFGLKSLNAQKAGAAAVLICNFEDAFVTMGAGAVGNQVTIPAYFTTKTICNRLKMIIANGGLTIEIREPGANAGPDSLDGDFDNGVIAHEFGHGISTRLTGGPANSNCLGNQEQMGEGWSDFMALIMQAKTGDIGNTSKGIGTYVQNEKPDGYGIRRRPYSTDITKNEFTYKNIDTESHNLGEVWSTVLWDLYWAFAAKYGYDPDFKNKTAGNNIAIQLVFDGMKLQPCSPGFLDGRNAILKADTINNQGKNGCLIWEVFARRGMGYLAKQGSSNVVHDETESFLPALVCVNKVLVEKKAGYYKDATTFIHNDVVLPGAQFSITIDVNNYKPGFINNLVVTDNLPAGGTYVAGSANIAPQINGNQLVWTFTQLKSLETKRITYKVRSDPNISSTTLWYDDIEHGEDNWDIDVIKGTQLWYTFNGWGFDNSTAWIGEEASGVSNDYVLFTKKPFQLNGSEPSLLFYHQYNLEQGLDAGVLEVSKDGFFWEMVKPEEFSLNGYTGLIDYQTFVTPNIYGFTGVSDGFIPSVLDLSNYNNEKVQIRFRFGNDSLGLGTDPNLIKGWLVDNVEFIYPKFYNGEVCITTNEGDNTCASLFGKGILADSDKVVGTTNEKKKESYKVYPNPAANYFLVNLKSENEFKKLFIRSINGQELRTIDLTGMPTLFKVLTEDLPKGMVVLEFRGDKEQKFAKIMIGK